MTGRPHFRFASQHRLDAPRDPVFEVLADAERWGDWWPQIRQITAHDEVSGSVVIRSALPRSLHLQIRSEIADRESGVLRATLGGDLVGWSQFALTSAGPAYTTVDYTQEVDLVLPGIHGLIGGWRLARPVLIANHRLMMRAGMRGLNRAARSRSG